MFGECHAHMIMDGVNYKKAVAQHKDKVVDAVIRQRFEEYAKRGIFFIRDGGDACAVTKRAAQLACEYGITYRTPVFAIHKRGHYGGIVGLCCKVGDLRSYNGKALSGFSGSCCLNAGI